MNRYVDAELLAVTYMETAKEMCTGKLEFLTPEDVAKTILKCADSCEEIAPVVHAHFERFINNGWHIACSACGDVLTDGDDFPDYLYCPSCGAKMDEVTTCD